MPAPNADESAQMTHLPRQLCVDEEFFATHRRKSFNWHPACFLTRDAAERTHAAVFSSPDRT